MTSEQRAHASSRSFALSINAQVRYGMENSLTEKMARLSNMNVLIIYFVFSDVNQNLHNDKPVIVDITNDLIKTEDLNSNFYFYEYL